MTDITVTMTETQARALLDDAAHHACKESGESVAAALDAIRDALPPEIPLGTIAKIHTPDHAPGNWALARKVRHGWSLDSSHMLDWTDSEAEVVEVIRTLPEGHVAVPMCFDGITKPAYAWHVTADRLRSDWPRTSMLVGAYADALDAAEAQR